jgi:hypothetical protein
MSVSPAYATTQAPAAGDFRVSATSDGSTNYGIISATGTTDQTVEMYISGQANITNLVEDIDAGANDDSLRLVITQGSGIFTYAATGAANMTAYDAASVSADNQSVTFQVNNATNDSGDAGNLDAYFRPTAAGKVVVQYQSVTAAGVATVVSTITIYAVTSAAASASGVISIADSFFYRAATCVTGAATNVDADTSNEANGGVAYLSFRLRDAYGAVNAVNGALVATSSSKDAVVAIDGAPTSTSTSTAVGAKLADGGSGTGACVGIAQATSNKPVTTTVTVTFNGVVVGSKTVTIVGQLAKLTMSSSAAEGLAVAPRNASSGTHFYVLGYDSAGNRVGTASAPTVDSAGLTPVVSNVVVSGALATTDSPGKAGNFACSATTSGSSNVRVSHVDSVGTTIYSNAVKAQCGGTTPYSVTASLDKASYVPGDVATLTLNAKDSQGQVVADSTTTGSGYAVAGSNMTAVTAPTTTDTFTWGTKTYKFVVGSTEGSYAMSISLPAYAATGVADITVPYTIKASTATVSNADVLKSIVSLIASINKQIQALQKLILRR